jgi:hypothetical protein
LRNSVTLRCKFEWGRFSAHPISARNSWASKTALRAQFGSSSLSESELGGFHDIDSQEAAILIQLFHRQYVVKDASRLKCVRRLTE